jgi:hypothetical protein
VVVLQEAVVVPILLLDPMLLPLVLLILVLMTVLLTVHDICVNQILLLMDEPRLLA